MEHANCTTVRVADLQAAIDHYSQQRGYRLDMIMPADSPRLALMSCPEGELRLQLDERAQPPPPYDPSSFVVSRPGGDMDWPEGRAGMQYRDLIPSRLGGALIASHIRIPEGGPVADYVHFHRVGFQVIYCQRGWVRVVYEDQGPPFVMNAGDCVLQPPTIRHRVLEASPGLQVIELASPAEHETWRDHDLQLPNAKLHPDRLFEGQRFVRHVAADNPWTPAAEPGFLCRETGVGIASAGAVQVRVLRAVTQAADPRGSLVARGTLFFQVLSGQATLTGPALGQQQLDVDAACTLPPGTAYTLEAAAGAELLAVGAA